MADQRYLIWKQLNEKSDAWQTEQKAIREAANRKRAEAAKEQHKATTPRHGETMVVAQPVPPPKPAREKKGQTAKAAASKTNRGAVARTQPRWKNYL